MFEDITLKGRTNGVKPIINNLLDLHNAESSLELTQHGFLIILAIPLERSHDDFKIFQYKSLPFKIQNNLTFSIIPTTNMIAVNSKNDFVILEKNYLHDCKIYRHIHVCPDTGITYKEDMDTCLSSLFFQDMDRAKQLCPIHYKQQSAYAIKIAKSTYQVFYNTNGTFVMSCQNGSFWHEKFYNSMTIKVPPSCQANMPHMTLYSSDDVSLEPQVWTYNWNISEKTFKDINFEKIANVLANIEDIHAPPLDLSDINNYVHTYYPSFSSNPNLLIFGLITIVLFLGMAFALWAAIKILPQKKEKTTKVPKNEFELA